MRCREERKSSPRLLGLLALSCEPARPLILRRSNQDPTEMHRENLHTRFSGIFSLLRLPPSLPQTRRHRDPLSRVLPVSFLYQLVRSSSRNHGGTLLGSLSDSGQKPIILKAETMGTAFLTFSLYDLDEELKGKRKTKQIVRE